MDFRIEKASGNSRPCALAFEGIRVVHQERVLHKRNTAWYKMVIIYLNPHVKKTNKS